MNQDLLDLLPAEAVDLDLYQRLQVDPDFASTLEEKLGKLNDLFEEHQANAVLQVGFVDLSYDIYQHCGFNCAPLVPYFYPNAIKEGKRGEEEVRSRELNPMERPFQVGMFSLNPFGSTVLRGSRQLGKTVALIARLRIHAELFPGRSAITIIPKRSHLETFRNKFADLERDFIYHVDPNQYRQNLSFKEYPNRSTIEIIHLDQDVTGIRGKTAESLLFEETQDFDETYVPIVDQVQRNAKIPDRIFSGTSTTTDSMLESVWDVSSQGVWMMRTHREGKYIDMSDHNQVLPIIKPSGLFCPHTKQRLDVTNGIMHHRDTVAYQDGRIGYHIPQMLVPDYGNDPVECLKMYEQMKAYERAGMIHKFIEEVLGIPSQESDSGLTEQDLMRICNPDWSQVSLFNRAKSGKYYKYIISGVDWGGSDYNPAKKTKLSYTAHAIVGVDTGGNFDALHFREYSGTDYATVIKGIVRDHRGFHGTHIASDFSAGNIYNQVLRNALQTRALTHFMFQYGASESNMLEVQQSALDRCLMLNKQESLAYIQQIIKQDNPRLRCYRWTEAAQFLRRFLNCTRVVDEDARGRTRMKFRKKSNASDDTMVATDYAITLARILLNEPILERKDMATQIAIRQMLSGAANVSGDGIHGFSM